MATIQTAGLPRRLLALLAALSLVVALAVVGASAAGATG